MRVAWCRTVTSVMPTKQSPPVTTQLNPHPPWAVASDATSGGIAGFHGGVEYGWWEGLTACTATISGSGDDLIKSIMNAPLVRCDVAPWSLFGISLAGYNFLLSLGGAVAILGMTWRNQKP